MLYFTGEALEDDESVSVSPLTHTNAIIVGHGGKKSHKMRCLLTGKKKRSTTFKLNLSCTTCGRVFFLLSILCNVFMQFEEEELEEGDEEVS